MRILLAQSAGFCFGVKRAITVAFEAAEQHERLTSLGPLIHSPQMVRKLEEKGVEVREHAEDIDDGAVLVRSHGLSHGEIEALQAKQLTIVDATCPFVRKAQKYAEQLAAAGYFVVVVGEKDHPEVQGIVSYAGKRVAVVADQAEAAAIRATRIGIVAQTTQSLDNLREVVAACLKQAQDLRVFNTICDATALRQQEARRLSAEADLMLVVGGFNSANTTRLAQICREIQPRTHHVETAQQIENDWFSGVEVVGITAGASTPEWIIRETVARVESLAKQMV